MLSVLTCSSVAAPVRMMKRRDPLRKTLDVGNRLISHAQGVESGLTCWKAVWSQMMEPSADFATT